MKWKLVPEEEMTDAMIDAAQAYLDSKSLRGNFNHFPATFNWHDFWKAIVTVSPKSK